MEQLADFMAPLYQEFGRMLAPFYDYCRKEADVDYERNKVRATELSLHCARIGAPSMQLAAASFLLFRENNDIRGCHKAYSKLEAEFLCLRGKLELMVKLEQQIKLSGRKANE